MELVGASPRDYNRTILLKFNLLVLFVIDSYTDLALTPPIFDTEAEIIEVRVSVGFHRVWIFTC